MEITKMHGAGNDFIIINNIREKIPAEKLPRLAEKICTRRLSAGADGFMVVEAPKEGGDFRMLFFNSDGTVGEMCGNGARCIARYGYENGLAGETQRIETTAGLVTGRRVSDRIYTVRLNDPTHIDTDIKISVCGRDLTVSYIELGNPGLPHAVLIGDDYMTMDSGDLRALGRAIRWCEKFPKGANVNFCSFDKSRGKWFVRTYERGVEDFTLACGTGIGSSALTLCLKGLASPEEVKLSAPGGDLSVSLTLNGDGAKDIWLTGPTNMVYKGTLTDEDTLTEVTL